MISRSLGCRAHPKLIHIGLANHNGTSSYQLDDTGGVIGWNVAFQYTGSSSSGDACDVGRMWRLFVSHGWILTILLVLVRLGNQ